MGKNKKRKDRRTKSVERSASKDHGVTPGKDETKREVASVDVSRNKEASTSTDGKRKHPVPEEHSKSSKKRVSRNKEASTSTDEKRNHSVPEEDSKSSKKRRRAAEVPDPPLVVKDDKGNDGASAALDFPFPTEADDHCESPLEAYTHILPLLSKIASQDPSKLRIYDPYYCDGAVARNLANLGFPNVYNKKEDCYDVWSRPEDYPKHDAIVTNPPYSGDHIAKLMEHVTSPEFGNRPWFLLLPNHVHKHECFIKSTFNIRPFFLVPRKRYVYEPPRDFREAKKSDVHKKSSPFVSMWYIWGGDDTTNQDLIRHYLQTDGGKQPACDLARSKSGLRDLRRKKR